jgi:translocation and assembly module TamA
MGGCSWFFDEANADKAENVPMDLPSLPYKTMIVPKDEGESNAEVDSHLKAVSLLVKLEERPPTSMNVLHQRIQSDIARLKQGLAEKGYFDGQVDFTIKEDTSPITVTITYKTGSLYKISKITVLTTEGIKDPLRLSPSKAAKSIQLHPGDTVDLIRIQDANQRLAKYLRDHGYPFAEMSEPEGQIDRDSKQIHIIFRATPGRFSYFGKTKISGLKNLDPQFVRNRLYWQEGELYDERDLETTRHKLMGTGLFSAVDIKPDEDADPSSDKVPLSAQLVEGPPRTIGAGVKYATTEGLGGQAFWSHRNIFGSGEVLGASLRLSPRLSRAKVDLDIPDIFSPEQHLRNEVSVTREQNKAYTSRTFDVGMRLEHPFTESVTGMIGITGEGGKVKRANVDYVNRLIGLPLELKIDKSNDLIDPTKGGRLSAQVTPYIGKSGRDSRLVISSARGSYYLRILKDDTIVMAAWAHAGTINVSSIDNLAPNKRFYAGGAGSVRAYGYKMLGPLDTSRIPLGGRSILEYGLEGRFKATETIGFALFAEAGNVSANAAPSISDKTRLWGIGAGIRYYTAIGPIRFDIATPMKRRRDGNPKPIDSAYQFYLSVGQAF